MKKTIFISSTFLDLASHRKAIWDLLKEFDVAVRGMEQFGARTETPLDTCITEVEQSDIYVGVIAYRFGSLEPNSGKSYTQLEYERAQSLGKETLVYLIDEENASVQLKFVDKGTKQEKLEAFKRVLKERHTIDTFVSATDLVEKLRRDLKRHLSPSFTSPILDEVDEFSESSNTIYKFLLTPKKLAGREVRLEIKFSGDPYPASNEICSAFNYELGATIGIPIEIITPAITDKNSLTDLYLDEKQLEEFLPIAKGESRQIYAKLLFHDSPIVRLRARYNDASYFTKSPFNALASITASFGERIDIPADAKLILAYTKPAIFIKK